MLKILRRLPEASNVGAGKVATITCPLGRRYHVIWLEIKTLNVSLANSIGDIRVLINGVIQRVHDVALQLDPLNSLNGASYAVATTGSTGGSNLVNFVPIFFAEPWREEYAIQDGLAWNAVGINSLTIEVDIKAGAAAGLTILPFAEWDRPTSESIGRIIKWYRTGLPVTSTTPFWKDLPRRSGNPYTQISLFDANITSLKLDVDQSTIRDEFITKDRNDAILKARRCVPVASRFDIVFDYEDLPSSVLPVDGVQDFMVSGVLSDGTARNITTVYQLIGTPD